MTKPASGGMITLLGELGGAQTAYIAELITVTLASGTIMRFSTAEKDITFSGNVYSAEWPLAVLGTIGWKLGVEVDTLKLQLWARESDLLNSIAVLTAVVQGQFDNALVLVQRVFMPTWGDVSNGAIILFQGNIADIPVADAAHAEFDVKSRKELLNIPMPYRQYQPGCYWTLYGPGCTLSAASFQASGTIGAGSGQLLLNTNLSNPDQYFNQGYMTFLTGANTGVTRGIRQYASSGQILLFVPLINPVSTGDTFDIYPGCDKTQATCQSKFSNLANFPGNPYTPIPEASV